MIDLTAEDGMWLTFALVGSIVMLVASAAAVPFVIARIPADFFVRDRSAAEPQRTWTARLLSLLKNGCGILLVIAGIAMLLLPGQGVLTILAGLMLLNFPGKRRLELWVVSQPRVRKAIGWLRHRSGRPELILPEPEDRHTDSG